MYLFGKNTPVNCADGKGLAGGDEVSVMQTGVTGNMSRVEGTFRSRHLDTGTRANKTRIKKSPHQLVRVWNFYRRLLQEYYRVPLWERFVHMAVTQLSVVRCAASCKLPWIGQTDLQSYCMQWWNQSRSGPAVHCQNCIRQIFNT